MHPRYGFMLHHATFTACIIRRGIYMSITDLIIAAIAAMGAGVVNAIAGGGTLITFPVLTALGLPAVVANVTNTIALSPGYLGGTFAQWNDLKVLKRQLWLLVPISVLGGLAGGALLLWTGEKSFRELVPYLILLASLLLAVQGRVRQWLVKKAGSGNGARTNHLLILSLVTPAAVYGGYFGAGVSVIVLAVLGLAIDDSIVRLNALKQAVAFCINVTAALFFLFSGKVYWMAALVMAAGALLGGVIGGKLAGKLKPAVLRWTVVAIGFAVAVYYFVA